MKQKLYVCIEGIVGAGKSSIGRRLDQNSNYRFIEEPVSEWIRSGWLERFYSDISGNAFNFQVYTFTTRLEVHDAAIRSLKRDVEFVLLERSIYTDRFVFAEMLHKNGSMSDHLFKLYCHLWNIFALRWPPKPDLIFYLDVPARVALERIAKRGRESEVVIDELYLVSLDTQHRIWLKTCGFDYFVIDATRSEEIIVEEIKRKIDGFGT